MNLTLLSPRKSLNKAFLKVKPSRSEIDRFKKNLMSLLDGLDETESEEHNKNDLGDFLKNSFYSPNFYINTKGRNDLVIHSGPDSKSAAVVLIEAKKPGNKCEMLQPDNLNAKAFHELILYYLRERITGGNLEIKHLIATNVYEWFIFDAGFFEKTFAQNKTLVKQFTDFEEGRLAGTTTDFFYKSIAEPFVSSVSSEVPFTYFDFRDYYKPLRNKDKADDASLIALYKVLSPEHLLKLPFLNDSNTLDKSFYAELLHIIGLTEIKSGSKKLIERKKEGTRHPGSLLENTILQLDTRDKISRLQKPSQFGETLQERLFNVSLELVITWLNRILFLKLLEAQMIRYHKGDPEYGFLNISRIHGFDDLDNLFFRVLARQTGERDPDMLKRFSKVPYLNSSLFEPTELEHQTIFISNLQDQAIVPIFSSTVLKDNNGKRRTGDLNGLQYLFQFLDSYDFAGEGSEEIQEDNKSLINASVLGLIFEKLNGYKDGSFFTPGFITMYMCRETIRRAVVQKFNEAKGWNCEDIGTVYDKIEDNQEANRIINSLKICDPAVGSGHFLVSALNEIIAIKSDLRILTDRQGRRLKEYLVEVVNDELVVTDEDGEFFEYLPGNNESQRIQEAIFHEKQTIIENCLFGVDINPNSVKICRLRLWIELLKSAYYKSDSSFTELETLPNIDINIKCGNSLISRYALDADIKQALKKSKWSIDSYRLAVMTYRNAQNKEQKREMEGLINKIKNDFQTEIGRNDPLIKKIDKLTNELYHRFTGSFLFEPDDEYGDEKVKEKRRVEQKKIEDEIVVLTNKVEEIKENKIFENAFEWRFEFPEVLNDDGDFVGFDVVIGNPPYLNSKGDTFSESFKRFAMDNFETAKYQIDTYILFIEKSLAIISGTGFLTFITPNAWLNNLFLSEVRKFILENIAINEICNMSVSVFEEASVDTIIFTGRSTNYIDTTVVKICINRQFSPHSIYSQSDFLKNENFNINIFIDRETDGILKKIESDSFFLERCSSIARGVGVYHKRVGHTKELIQNDPYQSFFKKDDTFVPYIKGKNVKSFLIDWRDNSYISYGKWLAEPREPKYFEGSRILMRQIPGKRLIATYIEEQFITDQSVFIAKFKDAKIQPKAVLGILSSSLMSFYFRTKHSEFDILFPKVKLQHFKNFPIHNRISEFQNELVEKVDYILSIKKTDPSTDTSALEAEIDCLVYELYGLTEEEIRIVEGEKK